MVGPFRTIGRTCNNLLNHSEIGAGQWYVLQTLIGLAREGGGLQRPFTAILSGRGVEWAVVTTLKPWLFATARGRDKLIGIHVVLSNPHACLWATDVTNTNVATSDEVLPRR